MKNHKEDRLKNNLSVAKFREKQTSIGLRRFEIYVPNEMPNEFRRMLERIARQMSDLNAEKREEMAAFFDLLEKT